MSTNDRASRFRDFVRQHEPGLRAYLARRAPAHAVDDLVQEVLLVAWNRFDFLETAVAPGTQRAWLCGVARNHRGHELRADARRHAREDRSGVGRGSVVLVGDGDPSAEFQERHDALRVLAALSPDDRDFVIGVVWDGFTTAELAVVHGISEPAARKRLSRAMSRLRDVHEKISREGDES